MSILLAIITAAVLIIILMMLKTGSKASGGKKKDTKKAKTSVLRDAERKLAHDPHNVSALQNVGEIYFSDKLWDNCFKTYKTLFDISAAHVEVNVAQAARRMGIAAFNLEQYDEALNGLMVSVKKDPDSFEGNYYLGRAFYIKEIYDKAIICFKKAKSLMPENTEINQFMGLCFFKLQKYRECLPFLKRVLEEHPDNKEILFNMAVAMTEVGMGEKALKVFMHLRPDPQFGAQSCLEAGKTHEKTKDFVNAVKDYEIALKLENVPEQISLQIKYRLSNALIAMNDISKALVYLRQIQEVKTGYKDVDALVVRYSELNQNKNLQTYIMAGTSDFVALCRKFISTYYKNSFVKVEDVSVASESIEIICSIENPKWEARQLFRFYRTQTVIGDVYIREFHGKLRDVKCDQGICVTLGSFSESAHKFTDGRPIDLIEKDQLSKILKKINMLG